ncbi:MAG: HAD-IB family phosphatase [Candidatus Nanopelagicales bacterium]
MDGTLLVILSGRDRPGVTAAFFEALRHHRTSVLDIQQLVVRGRLVLAVLLGVSSDDVGDVRAAAHAVASQVGMEIETVPGAQEIPRDPLRRRIHVTVMSPDLRPGPIADLARTMADNGWNIDRIRRIAAYPVTAVVFEGSGEGVEELRHTLAECSARLGVDIAVQHAGLDRRGARLVVMDVDSTLIQDEVIDILAEMAGRGPEVVAITESAMAGDLDFAESLHARVAALEGLPAEALQEASQRVRFTPGARTLCRTLRRLGFRVCLVSGGFEEVIAPLADVVARSRIGLAVWRVAGHEPVSGITFVADDEMEDCRACGDTGSCLRALLCRKALGHDSGPTTQHLAHPRPRRRRDVLRRPEA